MGLSCGAQVLRWATFAFSIVVFVFGLAVVIIGSVATFFLKNSYGTLIEISAAIPIVALVVGLFIFIVEIALCVVTLTKKTELGAAVQSMVNTSFYKQFNDPTIMSAFGMMEEEVSPLA
nr:unnamed protein product [Spirometra erinaceieuropaei]